MKRILLKIATMIVYLLILLWLVDFKLLLLFNAKYIVIVLLGSVILTLFSYQKGMVQSEIIASLKWNLQITGYLTTFMLQISYLSGHYDTSKMMYELAMNCRPLLYVLIFYIIINSYNDEREEIMQGQITEVAHQVSDHSAYLKNMGLSSREIEIVFKIIEGLSNKSIAEQLYISENTVKKHIYNIFIKLGVSNREQLKTIIETNMKKST